MSWPASDSGRARHQGGELYAASLAYKHPPGNEAGEGSPSRFVEPVQACADSRMTSTELLARYSSALVAEATQRLWATAHSSWRHDLSRPPQCGRCVSLSPSSENGSRWEPQSHKAGKSHTAVPLSSLPLKNYVDQLSDGMLLTRVYLRLGELLPLVVSFL